MPHRPPPDGFSTLDLPSGFIQFAGPLFGRDDDSGVKVGFRVEPRYCNLFGNCHGGWLATMADIQLALACKGHPEIAGRYDKLPVFVTINLNIDFPAPAPLGTWVEGKAEVLRVTRNTAFTQMIATADGLLCLRASGIFKL